MAQAASRKPHARVRNDRIAIAGALAMSVGVACGVRPETGPVDPAWDRDTCERCAMILSDRRFAAQLRYAQDRTVRHFDDLGCAIRSADGVVAKSAGSIGKVCMASFHVAPPQARP